MRFFPGHPSVGSHIHGVFFNDVSRTIWLKPLTKNSLLFKPKKLFGDQLTKILEMFLLIFLFRHTALKIEAEI